ncbi:MAG: GEVED domain-containing protein, partial [Saprospiraceae bacterium]
MKYLFILLVATLFALPSPKAQSLAQANDKAKMDERVRETLKENAQTIRFLENKGQIDNKDVLYYFESDHGSVYIEKNRIRFVAVKDTMVKEEFDEEGINHQMVFKEAEEGEMDRKVQATHTFSLYMDGARALPKIKLGDSFSTNYNYYLGTDSKNWATKVKAAKDLTLEDVYPGIDLRLYSNTDGTMEFDWLIAAGADFNNVKLRFEGQDGLSINSEGALDVGLRFTDVKFHIPESYQVTDQGKSTVDISFQKSSDNIIGFSTQNKIDPRYPLIIDPTLSWGTFMDGNSTDFDQYLFSIQVDNVDGMVYCAGASNLNIQTGAAPYDANGYLNTITGLTGGTPRVAILYRINSSGTDLVDLTLYGPGTVVNGENTVAYSLSLSTNKVMIGGYTNADIPTTGSPFDGTRNSGDGFVAIFTKDLGTLNYATYLGGTGDDFPGVTSIRTLSDNSFVAGLTVVTTALPGAYISGGAADATFGGASEMYIAKFTTNNVLSWGSYVGGSNDEVFNDLEVFADGRVAFAGYGNGTLTEVNPAAANSTNANNTDGIIGVLNPTGTGFNYLDKIGSGSNGNGASGEDDRINDVTIVGETLYFTGSASAGNGGNPFPTTAGVYSTTFSGGLDAVVGKVASIGGAASYAATFYGSGSDDIGSGLKLVTQTKCDGTVSSFLLVFGSTTGSVPAQNIGTDPFFDSSNNGGLDIFFAGFKSDLTGPLQFGTNVGGQYNDYLGDTGSPRGANHLWVKDANIYVGTTIHSDQTTLSPQFIANGFDTSKSNTANPTTDDAHVIFSIQFNSFLETDYSDAPATYGAPGHTLDCTHLKIGTNLDAEVAAVPTTLANGDDLAGIDDEDGISVLPFFSDGGPQNVSVTVNNIYNTTGSIATLYGWIDFNSNGVFEANEFTSVLIPNGSNPLGTTNLTWTGVTVSGAAANHYLRIRLTTSNLNDNVGTPAVDERSTANASDGEIEDYRVVSLTCPTTTTSAPCLTQAQINSAYAD